MIERMFDEVETIDLAAWEAEEELVRTLSRVDESEPSDKAPSLPDIESLPAGLALSLVLATVDVRQLSGPDRVRYLQAQNRANAAANGALLDAINAVAEAYDELAEDIEDPAAGASFEIRSALRWTRRAAESELVFAHTLQVRLPRLFSALNKGLVDRNRAAVMVRYTDHLSVAHARTVVDRVLENASRLTTGQLSEAVRRACLETDPDSMREQRRQAVKDRRLVSWAEPDGTLSLLLSGIDPVTGRSLLDGIHRQALDLNTKDESRTIDQLRADVAVDILTGSRAPTNGRVHLIANLADLFDPKVKSAAELAGYGPVLADIAQQTLRQLTDAGWDWSALDPDSRMPIADGTTRRRPNASQHRKVRTRHRACVAPGCRAPVIDCDIDHTKPWAETGRTATEDSAPLCRHDHCIRHQTGWTYKPLPDGDFLWTGPLGTSYTTSGRDP
jgi:hypothetical protein